MNDAPFWLALIGCLVIFAAIAGWLIDKLDDALNGKKRERPESRSR